MINVKVSLSIVDVVGDSTIVMWFVSVDSIIVASLSRIAVAEWFLSWFVFR